MFLFTCQDEKSKNGIISIYSSDSNIFDYIRDSAQYLGKGRLKEEQLEEVENSYWKNVQKCSSLHNVIPIQYLDVSNVYKFDERTKEHKQVTQKSSILSQQQTHGIMDRIKKVPKDLFQSISAFMQKAKLEKANGNKEEERDDN